MTGSKRLTKSDNEKELSVVVAVEVEDVEAGVVMNHDVFEIQDHRLDDAIHHFGDLHPDVKSTPMFRVVVAVKELMVEADPVPDLHLVLFRDHPREEDVILLHQNHPRPRGPAHHRVGEVGVQSLKGESQSPLVNHAHRL